MISSKDRKVKKVGTPKTDPSSTGFVRKVDPEGLRSLLHEHEQALEAASKSITKQEEYQAEYESLTKTLRNLPSKLRHDALVPLGPLVMAKGKLIHTNEITCHIGDNWFVQCSTGTAEKVAAHRIQKSQEMLNKFVKEKELISSWISEVKRELTEVDSEGTVEIIETYDEEQEKEWRKKHREAVRRHYQVAAEEKKKESAKNEKGIKVDLLEKNNAPVPVPALEEEKKPKVTERVSFFKQQKLLEKSQKQ